MEDDDDISTMNPETAELSTDQDASNPTSALQDAWRIIVTMAHRLKHLETWHQQRLNARQNKGSTRHVLRIIIITDPCVILDHTLENITLKLFTPLFQLSNRRRSGGVWC
jgi:hypothetical protein